MDHKIRCGHCIFYHATAADVRRCWEDANAPQEVCCFSCDALIGWDLPVLEGARRGCGGPDICKRDFPDSF